MSGPAFFDSNILIYAFTQAGAKTESARRLLSYGGIISVQSVNETANTLRRKFNVGWPRIGQIVDAIVGFCPNPLPLTLETYRAGASICERHGFSIYDGLIVAAALQAHCTTLYTEDLQHGQELDSLRIENPFLS